MWLQRCLHFINRWYYYQTASKIQGSFKNCGPFTKCITKIDLTAIEDTEDLDFVMRMCDLIDYSSNYSETAGSLRFYSKDEATNFKKNIKNTDYFKSFKYKAKCLGNTESQPVPNNTNGILKNATNAAPLQ